MKISVLQENLQKALSITGRFAASRAQLPALNNVCLTTEKSRLKLTSTNLETGIHYWLGAKVEKAGSLTIPVKTFFELVSSLSAGRVELETDKHTLKIKSEGGRASLVGIPAADFPSVPSFEGKEKIDLPIKNLNQAVSQVAFAASLDESRPVLSGVLLKKRGDSLVMVATDGYRLSLKKINLELKKNQEELFDKGILLPAKTLIEVTKLLTEEQESDSFSLSLTPQASQAIFSLPQAEIVSRLIEGDFPDYEKIIPGKSTTQVTIEKEDLLRGIRTASIFARESANIVRLEVTKDQVKISANAPQMGDNLSTVNAQIQGKSLKIAFNVRFLLDFLSAVKDKEVKLEFSGNLNPGIFKTGKDKSFFHIIMPVRVQD